VGRGARSARAATLLAGFTVLAFAGATVRQGRVWRSETTLWSDAAAKFPASGWNQLDLANALAAKGDAAGARNAYARAAALEPRLAPLLARQGAELLRTRRPFDALLKLEQARALDPASFDATLDAAHAHAALGRNAEAEARFREAVALRPESAAARTGLGIVLAARGDLAGAIDQLEAAARAAPGDPDALRNLAAALEQAGDRDRAAGLRARAAALDGR
jgi:tetratricopeptide (TPR) repeat protein